MLTKYLPCIIIMAISFAIIIYIVRNKAVEPFGSTSPGTMVQLQTSHVPTEEDFYYYKYVYPKLVQKELYNMTGGL